MDDYEKICALCPNVYSGCKATHKNRQQLLSEAIVVNRVEKYLHHHSIKSECITIPYNNCCVDAGDINNKIIMEIKECSQPSTGKFDSRGLAVEVISKSYAMLAWEKKGFLSIFIYTFVDGAIWLLPINKIIEMEKDPNALVVKGSITRIDTQESGRAYFIPPEYWVQLTSGDPLVLNKKKIINSPRDIMDEISSPS